MVEPRVFTIRPTTVRAARPIMINGTSYRPIDLSEQNARDRFRRRLAGVRLQVSKIDQLAAPHRLRAVELAEEIETRAAAGDLPEAEEAALVLQIEHEFELEAPHQIRSRDVLATFVATLFINADDNLRAALRSVEPDVAGVETLVTIINQVTGDVVGQDIADENAAVDQAVAEGADPTVPSSPLA